MGVAERVIGGIADGCQAAGCALLGGETAEMPGFYAAGEYDLAGFCVGVVEKSRRVDGTAIRAGDKLLGLASSGFHSNGYSLVRKVFLEEMRLDLDAQAPGLNEPLGQALLRPTRIYVRSMRALADADLLRGAAHITGGGLVDNPTRMIPDGARLKLQLRLGSWPIPPIFQLLAAGGRRGARGDAPHLQHGARHAGLRPRRSRGRGRHAARTLGRAGLLRRPGGGGRRTGRAGGVPHAMNVGVLVSGSGTNLQALIDRSTRNELGPARLTVVGCNVPDCQALSRARLAGLPTFLVDHRDHSDRAAFDRALVEALRAHQVDLVVLAGFMRVLSGELLDAFPGRVINIHPALLPAFPGVHGVQAGVRRRRQDRRLHGSLRRPRRRHRPDHRPGRRAASGR